MKTGLSEWYAAQGEERRMDESQMIPSFQYPSFSSTRRGSGVEITQYLRQEVKKIIFVDMYLNFNAPIFTDK